MDFYELEENIKKQIQESFNAYLTEREMSLPKYEDSPLDLDKYKGDFTVFFDFDSMRFENLSNESMQAEMTLDLYFVRRNGTSDTLKKSLLQYVSYFYSVLYSDRSLNGLVDWSTISEMNFYDAVSGSNNIKITQISINLQLEDD